MNIQQRLTFAESGPMDSLESSSSLPGSVEKAESAQSDRTNCAAIKLDRQDDMRVRTRSLDLKSAFTRFSLNRRSTGVPKTAAVMKSTEQPSLIKEPKVVDKTNTNNSEKIQFVVGQIINSDLREQDDKAVMENNRTPVVLEKVKNSDLGQQDVLKTSDNISLQSNVSRSTTVTSVEGAPKANKQTNRHDFNLDQSSVVSEVQKDEVFLHSLKDGLTHDDKLVIEPTAMVHETLERKLIVNEERKCDDKDQIMKNVKNEGDDITSDDQVKNSVEILKKANGSNLLGLGISVQDAKEDACVLQNHDTTSPDAKNALTNVTEKTQASKVSSTSPLKLTRTRIISFRGNSDTDVKSPVTPKTPPTPVTPSTLRSAPLTINLSGRSTTRTSSSSSRPLPQAAESRTPLALGIKGVKRTGLKQPEVSRFQKPPAKKIEASVKSGGFDTGIVTTRKRFDPEYLTATAKQSQRVKKAPVFVRKMKNLEVKIHYLTNKEEIFTN